MVCLYGAATLANRRKATAVKQFSACPENRNEVSNFPRKFSLVEGNAATIVELEIMDSKSV